MKKIGLFLLLFLAMLINQGIVHSQSGAGAVLEIVDNSGPIVNLIAPINSSGSMHENVTFFYNVSDASAVDNCSLIINNKINATDNSIAKVPSENFFNVNNLLVGPYNWSVNCTDHLGFIGSSENRTFSVIFMAGFNGTITNLSAVDIRNITNFVVEISTFGKINFSEAIDLSHGFDLNEYINISFNKIELDSMVLFTLNKSATLQLAGLTFAYPRIVRDGIVCPDTICKIISYSGGILTFNVSHFTSYEAEETPSEAAPAAAGGGGGGAGGGAGGGRIPVIAKREFTLSKETLKVVLKQGQTKEETIAIKNTGDLALAIDIDFKKLADFMVSPSVGTLGMVLQPAEEKTILLVFKAGENQKPDVYPKEIYVKETSSEKIISAVIEVDSAKPLFDVDVNVLPEYKAIYPGEGIFMEVSLFNVRGFGRVDVNLEYSIKDFKDNLIAKEEETVAVETQAKFTRELLIPSDIKPGTYVASVKVTFEDSVGISSDVFEVKAKEIRLYSIAIKDYMSYLLLGIVIIAFSVSAYLVYEFKAKKKYVPKTKEEETKVIKTEEKIQKLEKELKALEQAYKSKLISEESYRNNKERVEKELEKLRK